MRIASALLCGCHCLEPYRFSVGKPFDSAGNTGDAAISGKIGETRFFSTHSGTAAVSKLLLTAVLWAHFTSMAAAAPPEVRPEGHKTSVLEVTFEGRAKLLIGAFAHEINGRLAICGAVWPHDQKTRGQALSVKGDTLSDLVVKIGGRVVQGQFRVFRTFNSEEEANEGAATCTVTNMRWKARYATDDIELSLRTGLVH